MPPLSGESNEAGINGVRGTNTAKGDGVWGHSEGGRGVVGWGGTDGRGVVGGAEEGADSTGVWGDVKTGRGVVGLAREGANSTGVWGRSDAGRGVVGESQGTGVGVAGFSEKGTAIRGETNSDSENAVVGIAKAAAGIYGESRAPTGWAGFFRGRVWVDHSITAYDLIVAGADCAENFDIGEANDVEPGTVMVIGDEAFLKESDRAYDKRVAGVVSGAGTYRPGLVLGRQESEGRRVPLALVGKVYCKVDADCGTVEVGDLLTTSPTPGHAMKAADVGRAFGAVLGKALAPLRAGRGLVPILVTLQ
jgi:hypothetical protein